MPAAQGVQRFKILDCVRFVNEDYRAPDDGDGIYVVVGLQAGVKLPSGWRQPELVTVAWNDLDILGVKIQGIKTCPPIDLELLEHA